MEVLDYRMAALRVVRIRGRLDEADVGSFVRQVYREILDHPGDILLNLEGVDRICVQGIAVVYHLVTRLEHFGAQVGIVVRPDADPSWEDMLSAGRVRRYASELGGVEGLSKTTRRNLRGPRPLIDDRKLLENE